MKKICLIGLSLMLIAALAWTAFAAGKITFTMTASEKELSAGDTFTLTASCSSAVAANSYGLLLKFDEEVFEVVSGKVAVENTLVKSTGSGNSHGFVFMFQEAAAYSGTVGTMELKVKETAPAGTYTVTGAASVKNGTDVVESEGCAVTVTVGNTAAQESTAASEPNVGEMIESITRPEISKPIVKDEDAVPATGEAPRPSADSTLTIGAMPEEKDGEDQGPPAWIFLIAAGVIAVAGLAAFAVIKKKKS